jgi:primosomal protein N' (replication factor Y)
VIPTRDGQQTIPGMELPEPADPGAACLIAEVALDCPGQDSFSYRVPDTLTLAVGDCVEVTLGSRRMRGFVISLEHRIPGTQYPLKDVLARRPHVQLPQALLALIRWGARYYRCSLGEFLAGAVPAAVRAGTQVRPEVDVEPVEGFTAKLTPRQRSVLALLPRGRTPLAAACAAAQCTASVLQTLVKRGALLQHRLSDIQEVRLQSKEERHPLSPEQRIAVSAVEASLKGNLSTTFLLYGVTGSGKTLVYIELALQVISQGRQCLMLLPEIALTPQLAARLRSRIPRTAVWHSAFTDGERALLWREVAAGAYDLVLGTRSALFAPLPNIGLLIVDEEHEQSYKQESVPRYHARDLAVVYSGLLTVPVILGSATPSLESVHNARSGRYQVLSLRSRPRGGRLPSPVVVDMREECHRQKAQALISLELVERLRMVKRNHEQAIVLLNRRGWSPVVMCQACGVALSCTQCAISMTFHKAAGVVRCHYCDAARPLPRACAACGAAAMHTSGIGTEQLTHALSTLIPELRVLRVDADTVHERQGHAKLFQAFSEGAADCLVGTQMVAKGLDFPRVTLVGVLAADSALAIPDFRASERTYQLIAQVSGRAGRGERPGVVVVQAFDTQAPALRCALEHHPRAFVDAELALRQEYRYPPYGALARWLWSGESLAAVQLQVQAHGAILKSCVESESLLGPGPAGLAFLKGHHRYHLLLKASSRSMVQAFLDRLQAKGGLRATRGVRVSLDVDPYAIS